MSARNWRRSDPGDPQLIALYDQHYSRQRPGGQCSRPARDVVLSIPGPRAAAAGWVSLAPQHQAHDWPGTWECMWFRNARPDLYLSSELIREALALTVTEWGPPPPAGMVTFVDVDQVKPKPHPGYCFRVVGFEPVGWTRERGKLVLHLRSGRFPPPIAEPPAQLRMAA